MTIGSNRDNPGIVVYYQDLADIIGIFWQFQKERLQTKNIEFAMVQYYDGERADIFWPEWRYEKESKPGFQKYYVLTDFADGVTNSMAGSWQQFMEGLGMDHHKDTLDAIPVPQEQQRYFNADIRKLAKRTNNEAALYHPLGDPTLEYIVPKGIMSGSEATVYLTALFKEQFSPHSVLRLAKIGFDNLNTGLTEVGVPEFDQEGNLITRGNYNLIGNSPDGLDTARLRELDLGSTLGCPAAMRISEEAKKTLKKINVHVDKEIMLGEFAAMMPQQLGRYVEHWYNGLSGEARGRIVNPENRAILDGRALRGIRTNFGERPHSRRKEG